MELVELYVAGIRTRSFEASRAQPEDSLSPGSQVDQQRQENVTKTQHTSSGGTLRRASTWTARRGRATRIS